MRQDRLLNYLWQGFDMAFSYDRLHFY